MMSPPRHIIVHRDSEDYTGHHSADQTAGSASHRSVSRSYNHQNSLQSSVFTVPSVSTPAAEPPYEHGVIYESNTTRIYRIRERNQDTAAQSSGRAVANSASSDSFPPRELRVGQPGSTSCHQRTVAVKTLIGRSPTPDAISKLYNEYRVLEEHLGGCPSAREVIRQGEFEGAHHAIFLEWADGATLREWTRSHPIPAPLGAERGEGARAASPTCAARGLANYVHAMLAVASALADVHEAGVAHGNLSLDNVIIREKDTDGHCEVPTEDVSQANRTFQATLIDFGLARPMSVNKSDGARDDLVWDDLHALGRVFLGMLQETRASLVISDSTRASVASETTASMMRTEMTDALGDAIRSYVPESVVRVVSKLLELGGKRHINAEGRTITAREVEQDLENVACFALKSPLEGEVNNCRCLFEFDSTQLFGRDREMSEILSAYEHVRSSSSSQTEIVLLEGYSGTGKTALVQQLRAPVAADSGFFISGKFDQLCHAEPYTAISAAFVELCDLILTMDEKIITEIRESILRAIGPSWRFLAYIIPNLRQIVLFGATSSFDGSENDNDIEISCDSFHFIFLMFLKAICCGSRPVVLFIDDMQWADNPSLDLLKVLLTDPEIASLHAFLFLGAYRSNEVKSGDPLLPQFESIERSGVTITKIEVGDLSEDVVNNLISAVLDMPKDLSLPLAGMVHQKTNGNVFYTIELLRSLCDEGLLHFSIEDMRWEWDEHAIRVKEIADNVVGLLSSKIRKLPESAQTVMKLAACIGAQFEEPILHLLSNPGAEEKHAGTDASLDTVNPWVGSLGTVQSRLLVVETLLVLVSEGLMYKLAQGGCRFKFAHDRVQQAAYSLIPGDDRSMWHFHIGRTIHRNASRKELERNIFTVADQMNRGLELARSRTQQIDLAYLNLCAGRKAMSSSAFVSAASYLRAGIDLLGRDEQHWELEYNLSLRLYNDYTTAAYCNGNFDQTEAIIEQDVLPKAQSLHDKAPSYILSMKALGARDRLHEAIAKGFEILDQLGEPFPNVVSKSALLMELMKTKFALCGKNDANIISLPKMKDKNKIAAMEVLGCIIAYSYMARADLIPLVVFRMVRLSIRYGICEVSSYAFALYGLILCGALGEIERGYKSGQVALSLLDRSKSSEWVAKVYLVVHALLSHWKLPLKASFEPLLDGYEKGMKVGDVETAMMNVHAHCAYHCHLGCPLGQTEEVIRKYHQVMVKHNQDVVLGIHLIFWQTSLNLMGQNSDPVELTGEVMNQDRMIKDSLEKGNSMELCFLYYHRMVLAFLFGEHILAAEMGEKSRNIGIFSVSNFVVTQHKFYEGLNAIALSRKTKERKWRKLAMANKKVLKKWDKHSSGNRLHMVMLLKAELGSLKGQLGKAKVLYDSAIVAASEAGFLFDKAIANERAAMFFLDRDEEVHGMRYLAQALECYLDYGAHAKANRLRRQFPSLEGSAFTAFETES